MAHRFLNGFVCVSLCTFLCSCSVYPLPEDAIELDSEQIATIIRCQTRDSIREQIIDNLEKVGDTIVYQDITGRRYAEILRQDKSQFRKLIIGDFSEKLRNLFNFYKNVSVSYDFTIDTTEVNGAGISASLVDKYFSGSNTFGITAKNDRTREVKRHFRIFDSFESLAILLDEPTCSAVPNQISYIYPITGLVKIHSLVRSFLRQNQRGNLGGDGDDYSTAQMADTITFSTKSTGNFDPTIATNQIVHELVPASVGFNVDNSREDHHTVIILLRLPANTSDLPRFDKIGRLLPEQKENKHASEALDKARIYNVQDDVSRILRK